MLRNDLEKVIEEDAKYKDKLYKDALVDIKKKTEEEIKKSELDKNFIKLRSKMADVINELKVQSRNKEMLVYELSKIDGSHFVSTVEFDMYKTPEFIRMLKTQKKDEIKQQLVIVNRTLDKLNATLDVIEKHYKKFKVQ